MGATAHINFIAASYAAAAIVIGGLIAWVSLDFRAQRHSLAELEAQGVGRRSAATRADRALEPSSERAKENKDQGNKEREQA